MPQRNRDAEQAVKRFVMRTRKGRSVDLDTPLYSEGIGLDSLETAELAAVLEDELGTDPFSDGLSPNTVGEIVDYYEKPPTLP